MSIEKRERELFLYELNGHGYHFKNTDWHGDWERFEDEQLNMVWEMWIASTNRELYKLVPVEPDENQWDGLARHLGRYMQTHYRYCPKTLKKYFDRFIGEPPEWMTKEVGNWDSDHAFATADLPVFIYKAMIGACDEH